MPGEQDSSHERVPNPTEGESGQAVNALERNVVMEAQTSASGPAAEVAHWVEAMALIASTKCTPGGAYSRGRGHHGWLTARGGPKRIPERIARSSPLMGVIESHDAAYLDRTGPTQRRATTHSRLRRTRQSTCRLRHDGSQIGHHVGMPPGPHFVVASGVGPGSAQYESP